MSISEARDSFKSETGFTPEDWVESWKVDRMEDSPDNMKHTIHALSILAEESSELGQQVQVGASTNSGYK
ncbi:MAG: hypothetical protein JJE13_06090 [Thermoleophilia bacterium]|nr:hypothetical protein [Thermoleophilia bacterium]